LLNLPDGLLAKDGGTGVTEFAQRLERAKRRINDQRKKTARLKVEASISKLTGDAEDVDKACKDLASEVYMLRCEVRQCGGCAKWVSCQMRRLDVLEARDR
jgi:septal ring factor EnvC (AmiA/AmiB activator)